MAKNLKKQTPSFIFHFHGNVGQNIAHVDKIEAHFDKDMNMQIINPEESAKVVPAITTTPPDSAIPAELNKPATIQLLDRARDAGWLDENYQPMISKTRAAILAQVIGQLQSVQPRWRPFEKLWHREHMCKDYAKAQSQPSTGEIELEMKHQLTP